MCLTQPMMLVEVLWRLIGIASPCLVDEFPAWSPLCVQPLVWVHVLDPLVLVFEGRRLALSGHQVPHVAEIVRVIRWDAVAGPAE